MPAPVQPPDAGPSVVGPPAAGPSEPRPSVAGAPGRPAAAWRDAVLDAERRAELLDAFDLASRGLEEHPGDPDLRYRAVLALARTGSTGEAARQFAALELASVDTEDVAALQARIQKDEALAVEGDERRRRAARAAESYRRIADRTHGYFPAINAATLTLVAGQPEVAERLAADVLALVETSGEDSYFSAATRAEAHLLMGDGAAAAVALAEAADRHRGDLGALSTTRRQLRLVCTLKGIDPAVLAPLAGPSVVHFCGHRMSGPDGPTRLLASAEAAVAAAMARVLDDHPVGVAYGSMASGADIMWAEHLVDRGAELHLVLPFDLDEFVAVSVAPAGPEWVERFTACLARADSVTYVTEDAFLGDDSLFRYCSDRAMGLALLRARYLDADVRQLAVWDGQPAAGPAGTAADVAVWRALGRPTVVVRPDGSPADPAPLPRPAPPRRPAVGPSAPPTGSTPAPAPEAGRVVRAMLMGDVAGFSKLGDQQLRAFATVVLGIFAEALDGCGPALEFANTWGDALYAVFASAPVAARCALEIQERLGRLDLAAAGLPATTALRLSGHVGPVFPVVDPVIKQRAFMGAHVSRTARIEPVTPPGAVYVTEAFAAALELAGTRDLRCDYVGHLPTAKDYGRLRMYRLRRPTGGAGPR